VLVPDAFPFGSRRVRLADVPAELCGALADPQDHDIAGIAVYNAWAANHESVMSKSLLCGGTTWPGVYLAEDRMALDILCARPEVNPERVGCGGLSGGGMRTVFLGGADERIRCAVCVGLMTTWRDCLLNKSYTHTWMLYVPLLPNELDFPEILGLRVPLPTMVLNNRQDRLFTLSEMERADETLAQVYAKAEAPERYRCHFYDGPHKFDLEMQADAFAWFDRWLKE
jgi:dienelactone hydrolase